jgi:hypothetical protein
VTAVVPAPDGWYHPGDEAEVAALVAHARATKSKLRVRGAGHSEGAAIYTPGFDGLGKPPAGAIDVMLDRMRAVIVHPDPVDRARAVVEVEAGCHLGRDPYDPTGTSTWGNSLNAQLQRAGWALPDLGGITHQTVGGFLSTGSSGGSRQFSIHDAIVMIRFVDGTGAVHEVARDDVDAVRRDLFDAVSVSMGLLGVITRVWIELVPTYDVFGTQVTTATSDAAIDFFDERPDRPSYADFLLKAPYARLMWWPQHDFDRMVVWQATRQAPFPGFEHKPYLQLGRAAKVTSLAGSLLYALIGNLDDLAGLRKKLDPWFAQLEDALEGDPDPNACVTPAALGWDRRVKVDEVLSVLHGRVSRGLKKSPRITSVTTSVSLFGPIFSVTQHIRGTFLSDKVADAIVELVRLMLDDALDGTLAQILADVLDREMPYVIDEILEPFVELGTQTFWDSWMCGLPLDNQMDEQLWPTRFTELWVPIDQAADAMKALRQHYRGGGDPARAFAATGSFACEMYASKASRAWLSPSHGTDTVRFDIFWFGMNSGDPRVFYEPFWKALDPFAFRPHWGKILPGPHGTWRKAWRARFPRLADFLKLRATLDPDDVFLTPYWREHLVDDP